MDDLIKNSDFRGISHGFDIPAFAEALERGYAGMSQESKETKKTSFAPSGLGYGNGTCQRYWYYAFHGAQFEYDTDARSIANMSSGSAAGERLAKVLKNAGILVEAEVKVDHKDPPIGGFIDAIVKWQDEEIVCEIKTNKTEQWNHRLANMAVPGYQLLQLLIYMRVQKKDKGFFLVENKNTHELLVIPIKMNAKYNKLVDDTFEWMRMVKKNSDDDLLPTRPFTKSSVPCKR